MAAPGIPIELYDLKTDEAESRNVAAQHPEVARRFAEYLKTARVESTAFPVDSSTAKDERKAGK